MKPMFIISCPIDTYSCYCARSRDLVKAIIELNRYDVKILPQRWGNTPWNFIETNLEEWGFLKPYILSSNQIPKQPEICAIFCIFPLDPLSIIFNIRLLL